MTFSPDELEEMVNAISQKLPTKEEVAKIPLRPPGSFSSIAKVGFSPIEGNPLEINESFTKSELATSHSFSAEISVDFGFKKLNLKEIASLDLGTVVSLNDLCDDLVVIKVNGIPKARGEILAVDGQFGVRIVAFID